MQVYHQCGVWKGLMYAALGCFGFNLDNPWSKVGKNKHDDLGDIPCLTCVGHRFVSDTTEHTFNTRLFLFLFF